MSNVICLKRDLWEWAKLVGKNHFVVCFVTWQTYFQGLSYSLVLIYRDKITNCCISCPKLVPENAINRYFIHYSHFSSVQSLSHVRLFVTPWITARQASLSITNSRSSHKLMFTESVMPSSHLILCHPLLLLPSIPPSIRVFSNESTLRMRWPKYWSFSFSIIPSKENLGLISFRMDWLDLLAVQGTLKSLLQHQDQKHRFFSAQLSSQSNFHIHTWPQEKP